MFAIIFLGSIFLVLATVYLLLFTENASKSYPDYVLSALLLIQAWSVLIYLLMSSGYILNSVTIDLYFIILLSNHCILIMLLHLSMYYHL